MAQVKETYGITWFMFYYLLLLLLLLFILGILISVKKFSEQFSLLPPC